MVVKSNWSPLSPEKAVVFGEVISDFFMLISICFENSESSLTKDGKEFEVTYALSPSVYTFWTSDIIVSLPYSIGAPILLALFNCFLIL